MAPSTAPKHRKIIISKLDAAKRQLNTALRMWFYDGDPVCIHALAFAAYEIVHVVSKKRKPGRELLFDSLMIKEEHRAEWAEALKRDANFFKHARNDADGTIEFAPAVSEIFFMFTIRGLEICGEHIGQEERAFNSWMTLHHPELLAPEARDLLQQRIAVRDLEEVKRTPKDQISGKFRQGRTRPIPQAGLLKPDVRNAPGLS